MMIDSRFYRRLIEHIEVGDLAVALGCGFHGEPGRILTGFAPLGDAESDKFSFFDGKPNSKISLAPEMGACFVRDSNLDIIPDGVVGLTHAKPRHVFARACEMFFQPILTTGNSPISDTADIASTAQFGPGVVIGPGAKIGHRTYIGPNTVIGAGVHVGDDCQIGPNCSISFAEIGAGTKMLAGGRVGEAGFGLAGTGTGFYDTPHYGRVLIGENCTLGANMTIDRSLFGDTLIGDGSKFDNLVHIAHNCKIGKNFRVAAFTGIAGSCTIGDNVTMGGQAGLGDHLSIGDNAVVMAYSGVMHDVPAGAYWGGAPAKPARTFWRELTWLSKNAQRKKKNTSDKEDED